MFQIRAIAAACLVAASLAPFALAGENCKAGCGSNSASASGGYQLVTSDYTTSALMLSASSNMRIDVGPLLAQRPFRVGVDDVHRPGFNGMNWNGNLPGAYNNASGDAYAAGYGAAGAESAVILIHAGPRQIVAIHPFAPIPTTTADGQPMSPEFVRNLESQRSRWLNDNGFTGGVRTFTNEKPDRSNQTDARRIKPRGVIELNPEAPRFKSRMDVRNEPAPLFRGIATTGQSSVTTDVATTSSTTDTAAPGKSAATETKPTPTTTAPAENSKQAAPTEPVAKIASTTMTAENNAVDNTPNLSQYRVTPSTDR